MFKAFALAALQASMAMADDLVCPTGQCIDVYPEWFSTCDADWSTCSGIGQLCNSEGEDCSWSNWSDEFYGGFYPDRTLSYC